MSSQTLACLEASEYRSKRLKMSFRDKRVAEHNNYYSFSKAYYCSTSQIHDYYYYNNLEIGRALQAKDLTNLF